VSVGKRKKRTSGAKKRCGQPGMVLDVLEKKAGETNGRPTQLGKLRKNRGTKTAGQRIGAKVTNQKRDAQRSNFTKTSEEGKIYKILGFWVGGHETCS